MINDSGPGIDRRPSERWNSVLRVGEPPAGACWYDPRTQPTRPNKRQHLTPNVVDLSGIALAYVNEIFLSFLSFTSHLAGARFVVRRYFLSFDKRVCAGTLLRKAGRLLATDSFANPRRETSFGRQTADRLEPVSGEGGSPKLADES